MLKDLISHVKNEFGICESLSGDSADTGEVDIQGFSKVNVLCLVAPGANASDEVALKLEHGATGALAEVTADDLLMDYGSNDGSVTSGVFGTVAGDASDQIVSVGYIGSERYIKVTATESGGNAANIVAVAITKEALQKPVSD